MRFIILALTLSLLVSIPGHVLSETTDVTLKRVAIRSGAVVQLRHNKTRKALVNLSRDKLFESHFAIDDFSNKPLHLSMMGARALAMAEKLEAQSLSLLDAEGNNIVMVADGEVLDVDDVGPLKSPRIWAVSLKDQARPVASPIYLSPHLDRWVFAHAQDVSFGEGKEAVLHAEFDLESIQKSVSRKKRPVDIDLLAVTAEGWIVFDSRGRISTRQWRGSDDPADYFDRFKISGMSAQALLARQDAGELNVVGDGTESEILVYQTDNLYVVAIRNRPPPGAVKQ